MVELSKLCNFVRIVHSNVYPWVAIDLILICLLPCGNDVNMFVCLIFISSPCNLAIRNIMIYPAMIAFTDQYSLPNIFFDIGQL